MNSLLSSPDEPPPLARSIAGAPILHAALGFSFHLEPLVGEDGARLGLAIDRLAAAIGGSLRWAFSSVSGEVEPFSPGVLDRIASYPAQLVGPGDAGLTDPRARAGARAMTAAHYDKFGVACHGGRDRNDASPFSLRFYATVDDATEVFRADAMLSMTMPLTLGHAALEELAVLVAGDLRVRWGAAGLVYGAWELDRYGETRDALYAHARRHPGFDVGQHATWMRTFRDRIRTVSWLTFVGKELASRVRATGETLASDALVTTRALDDEVVVLRAGKQPEPGDVNRGLVPSAYTRADSMLRSIRAGQAQGVHFYAPWSSSTTEGWLRRFEVHRPA